MARRPDINNPDHLSELQLLELRGKLAQMPLREVEIHYKASWGALRYSGKLASPKMVQEMVQAWRELRRR